MNYFLFVDKARYFALRGYDRCHTILLLPGHCTDSTLVKMPCDDTNGGRSLPNEKIILI